MPVEMTIKCLMLDPGSNMPIVVLQDAESRFFLPIWVGVFEANAIALRLEEVETPRPMTHDLLARVIADLSGKVSKVIIDDLRESTFLAKIFIEVDGLARIIDCRPSDAIALALRLGAPIMVEESVLEKASRSAVDGDPSDENERLRKMLESLSPEDISKYEM